MEYPNFKKVSFATLHTVLALVLIQCAHKSVPTTDTTLQRARNYVSLYSLRIHHIQKRFK
jgi:hypothetical protein